MSPPGSDPIVAFYSGGRDAAGRTLAEILAWPDAELEAVHDYIQWVFPLTQPSGVNPSAPLVTAKTVGAFVEDRSLREGLRAALDRMLAFYGLRRVVTADGDVRVQIDESRFAARSATWLRPGNHNHLRLTRIMGSLSALGLPDEARGLQRCLTADVASGPGAGRITPQTLQFWRAAVER